MKEVRGELFTQEADAICITTNGFVKANGELDWQDVRQVLGNALDDRFHIITY